MAHQVGHIRITGKFNDVTCYKSSNGLFYARQKSSLTTQRFWKLKAFEGSRKSCRRFGLGNYLASFVYRHQPKEKRVYPLFCQLKRSAILLLKQGLDAEDVKALLQKQATEENFLVLPKPKKKRQRKAFPFAKAITANFIHLTIGRLIYLENKFGEDTLTQMVEDFFNTVKPLHVSVSQLKLARA